MALRIWALLLAGATGEGCVRLYVLWNFFGVDDLGFRLVRRAGDRQFELGRKLNKGHHQGTAARRVELQMEWWTMWKARPVLVSFFAASIFFRAGSGVRPRKMLSPTWGDLPPTSKVRTLPFAFCIHRLASSLTGCFHLPVRYVCHGSFRQRSPRG
ncbi:hypothetical protein QBC45DRAFT_78694 [Copromyces sp. CBS 386.78]|nr:hypothetical protein QBC45DRAFT_78694 [Copromyces sp. CBS 386.78]